MGTFVRRLVALTVVWLLATAALTYAAAQKIATPPVTTTTTASATSATETQKVVVVPDVRNQAYVFAEGTLGDAGFGWRVEGAVQGYAANTVVSQTPAAGTQVVDTGNPLIVLRLEHPAGVKEIGDAEDASPVPATALRLPGVPATTRTALKKTAAKRAPKASAKKKPVTVKTAAKKPAHRWPTKRPVAFAVAGARREPLDEMPLTDRADMLLRWIERNPKPTDSNVHHWLYQHAWIVAGARMGWWHGAEALRTLVAVDKRADATWGIGARSEGVAEQALTFTEAQAK